MVVTILSQLAEGGWSEFGLAGLVIGALFSGLFFMARWITGFVSKVADIHFKERDEWKSWGTQQLDLHRTERFEWKSQIDKCTKAHQSAMAELTDAVNKSK